MYTSESGAKYRQTRSDKGHTRYISDSSREYRANRKANKEKSQAVKKVLEKHGEKKEKPTFAGKESWSHKDKDFHKLNSFFQRGGK